MVSNSKIIYLKKENGAKVQAYVVDYLYNQKDEKTYVIISSKDGNNLKGFEIVGNQAVILGSDQSALFKNYKSNSDFTIVTDSYEDGLWFDLVKEIKEESEETIPIVYYVYDENVLNVYKADLTMSNVLKNIRFLQSLESVTDDNIREVIRENQYSEPSFLIYDKINDLEYQTDGTIVPLRWAAITDVLNAEEVSVDSELLGENEIDVSEETNKEVVLDDNIEIDGEPIIFYVYEQDIVKKYSGLLTSQTEDFIEVKNITTLEVIEEVEVTAEQFLMDNVEVGAYFVVYNDYNPTIENVNGKLIATAVLNQPIYKTEDMEFVPEENETSEEPKNLKQVLVFTGDDNAYEGNNHCIIWGCLCTVLKEEPFTLLPEKNGVKTIVYENEQANSVLELCQLYQNLYPNYSVYLLVDTEIESGDELILEPGQYIPFQADLENESDSLLESGRRVLTEEEMIAKRQKDLENLKKK